jgi:hypothetical protein
MVRENVHREQPAKKNMCANLHSETDTRPDASEFYRMENEFEIFNIERNE